jgi:hypothetical protein
MISPAFITEWSQQCPWISPAQVEQDLALRDRPAWHVIKQTGNPDKSGLPNAGETPTLPL